jgi:hypothetical protein
MIDFRLVDSTAVALAPWQIYGGGEAGFPKTLFFWKIKTRNLELLITFYLLDVNL